MSDNQINDIITASSFIDVTVEQMKDRAKMTDIKFIYITKDTTVEALEKELFLNDLA